MKTLLYLILLITTGVVLGVPWWNNHIYFTAAAIGLILGIVRTIEIL